MLQSEEGAHHIQPRRRIPHLSEMQKTHVLETTRKHTAEGGINRCLGKLLMAYGGIGPELFSGICEEGSILCWHVDSSFALDSIFASPETCDCLGLGVKVDTALSVKGVCATTSYALLIPSERKLRNDCRVSTIQPVVL